MENDKKNKRQELFAEVFAGVLADLKSLDLRERTHLAVVAIDRRAERNNPVAIPCRECHCVSGYTYDSKNDCVWVNGVEQRELGTIDFSVQVTIDRTGSWRAYLPLSPAVLEKTMSAIQHRALKEMRTKYPSPQYELHFIQMVSCK